ncbi:glutathione S-transferase [Oceanicola sp. 22II-s10i]|uniref:glutathione S-transferase family protein n=1 Tax=Oceanicola sp. 22II-s10i TaxID=1317116 RepID=UPI000B523AF8|nr:glutathione S-transferase family protein [Oceanicola sp. 22II-s10i]OWU86314.1 glutathione S-transferase [Oceanicola sp. 22II-s10i]
MLTFYHSPQTRSTRILALLRDLGALEHVTVKTVTIPRQDGSGQRDPANPHPEGKVPLLDHDGTLIWETTAIALYLTDLFPEAGLGPRIGEPERGAYLSWLAWYGAVLEPVYILHNAGLSHPWVTAAIRGVPEAAERLTAAFADGRPWLLGESYSAADLILHSPFAFFPDSAPEDARVRDWIARCMARPAYRWAWERDAAALAA